MYYKFPVHDLMKWFSFPWQANQKSLANPTKKNHFLLNPWLIKAILCPLVGSFILSGDVPRWQPQTLASFPSELVADRVNRIATKITVKVRGEGLLGSGIILYQQDEKYWVLTNQHVLRAGKKPFRIQTPDGKIHESIVVQSQTPSSDDLALLSFKSDREKYQTAIVGDPYQLKEEELIFAAGFPISSENQPSQSLGLPGFNFTTGQVATILDKPLQQGYQIAYTNPVTKGMSGGPLLDRQGKVVGINGRHAYPLWEAPDFYEDNSQPCQKLQDLITRSSLAIPVNKALALASQENLTIQSPSSESPDLSQKQHILSRIIHKNSSQVVEEAEKVSTELCE